MFDGMLKSQKHAARMVSKKNALLFQGLGCRDDFCLSFFEARAPFARESIIRAVTEIDNLTVPAPLRYHRFSEGNNRNVLGSKRDAVFPLEATNLRPRHPPGEVFLNVIPAMRSLWSEIDLF